MAYKKKAKKTKRHVPVALVHVKATFNNTLATVTDLDGNVIARTSGGQLQFKGARKSTPFAATQMGTVLGREMVAMGVKEADINLQGLGAGRDPLARAVQAAGINVRVLRDVTPIPHNGARPPKKRRV